MWEQAKQWENCQTYPPGLLHTVYCCLVKCCHFFCFFSSFPSFDLFVCSSQIFFLPLVQCKSAFKWKSRSLTLFTFCAREKFQIHCYHLYLDVICACRFFSVSIFLVHLSFYLFVAAFLFHCDWSHNGNSFSHSPSLRWCAADTWNASLHY